MENQVIQSFWYSKDETQNSFSALELLCISSFLYHNHQFHLYTYTPNDASMQYLKQTLQKCKNFQNLHIRDAQEILPKSEIFFDCKKNIFTIAGFSDYFRYNLLYQKGGWWVDMDVICMQTFKIDTPFVFATERHGDKNSAATCVIKGEKSSPFLLELIQTSQHIIQHNDYIPNKTLLDKLLKFLKIRKKRKEKTINWGIIGPKFLDQQVKRTHMEHFFVDPEFFCEINCSDAKDFIDPNYKLPSSKNIYALHAWNAIWQSTKQEKNLTYPQNCLLEKLKKQYLAPPPKNHSPL